MAIGRLAFGLVGDWLGAHWKDILDVVSVVATVAAAWLAWLAIRRGNAQAKQSADALVRERRIDFELDQLDQLHTHVMSLAPFSGPTAKNLQLLPDHLPMLRAVMGEKSTPEAEAALQEARRLWGYGPGSLYAERLPLSSGKSLGEAVREEVEDAIQRRLNERDQSDGS